MKIVCISDTHNKLGQMTIPDGDILIHAGDATGKGSIEELVQFNKELLNLPHKYKVVISGNHDFGLEQRPQDAKEILSAATYLCNSSVEIEGIKIYGSPVTPRFFDWAFNVDRGPKIRAFWEKIPEDTNILVTHGPPLGILDWTPRGEKVGCADLLDIVKNVVKPKFHIFGHIHGGYGYTKIGDTTFINASSLGENYKTMHPPIIVNYP